MKTDWILDALTDMRRFAVMNDMAELARQLDITAHVAKQEVRRAAEVAPDSAGSEIGPRCRARSRRATSN